LAVRAGKRDGALIAKLAARDGHRTGTLFRSCRATATVVIDKSLIDVLFCTQILVLLTSSFRRLAHFIIDSLRRLHDSKPGKMRLGPDAWRRKVPSMSPMEKQIPVGRSGFAISRRESGVIRSVTLEVYEAPDQSP
jgi:hypothetical protein